MAAASLPSDSTNVNIDMQENDGFDVIVQGFGGGVSASGVSNAPAVRFQQTGGGTWNVDTGAGCGGPWTQVSANQSGPLTASPVGGLLTLCVASYSPTVYGTLTATYNSSGAARTVNTLPLERYVADTVPGESPSSWGTLGGSGPQEMPWGFQELEAQAIAVRSYVLANLGGYGGYADTCDLFCQTYRGIEYETATSIAAANDTAGQVMVMPGGQIATTEYSASTGGYTSSSASGESPFTAVPDDGDAVCIPDVVQLEPQLDDFRHLLGHRNALGHRSAHSLDSLTPWRIQVVPATFPTADEWTKSPLDGTCRERARSPGQSSTGTSASIRTSLP